MKWLLVAGLCILIVGCNSIQSNQESIDWFTSNLNLPDSYSVHQFYYDSGFAGLDPVFENITFEVVNEEYPVIDSNSVIDQASMSEQLSVLNEYAFNESVQIGENTFCFLHEKRYVSSGIVCFKDNKLVLTEIKTYHGNHQSLHSVWRLTSFKYPLHNCDRGMFCDIILQAKEYNFNVCSELGDREDYCDSLVG